MKSLRAPAMLFAACLLVFGLQPSNAQGADPVPRLMKNIDSGAERVAAGAVRSLGAIFAPGGRGGDEKATAETAIAEKLDAANPLILRREAANALGRMKATTALDALKASIEDDDYGMAIASANAVRSILVVDEARAFLREIADDDAEGVRVAAFDALSQIAAAADRDVLEKGLDSKNWRIQTSAIRGLQRAVRNGARPEPEMYDRIGGFLGSEIANTSNAASEFLHRTRNAESVRALIVAAETHGDGTKSDPTWRTRSTAIRALRHMGWPSNSKAVPAVIRQLGDRTANVTNEARALLNQLREEKRLKRDQLYVMCLVELESSSNLTQQAGIMAEMGNHVPDAYASRVSRVAAKSLAAANAKDGGKGNWEVRTRSINLLGLSETTGAIEDIAACVSDDVPNVRQAAGAALSRLGRHCNEAQQDKVGEILMPWLLDTRDWRKTAIAARNIGYYPSTNAVAPLVKLLSHGIVNVKDGARHSLVNLVEHEDDGYRDQVQEALMPELKDTDLSWEYGARVLGALRSPETVPTITRMLTHGNWRVKENAAKAVQVLAASQKVEDEGLNNALIRTAQSDIRQVLEASNEALRLLAK